ncbi:MAG: bifunctional UDP-N-acetylglucosamine diphosphorylase/glucosamine-1-phosphate N-acetyltransferase GlmU [Frankiaceae bacterium]
MVDRPAAVVVLAAGEGTRMRSATTPKVLHRVGGRTLLDHVLLATGALAAGRTLVVVGHGRDLVTAHLAGAGAAAPAERAARAALQAVVQDRPNGTGHAVRVALDAAPEVAGTVVVVPGDAPLLSGGTLEALVAAHAAAGAAATLLTAVLPDPTGYGRIVRGPDGSVRAVVEERDADEATRAIREVGTSVYAFEAGALRAALARLTTDNAQGEEYLTDVVGILVGDGGPVGAVTVADHREAAGVNDRAQLAAAGAVLRDRAVHALMVGGATVVDPATTWVDDTVVVEPDAVIQPFTLLAGRTVVRSGATVGPHSQLTDTVVASGAHVVHTVAVGAEIGPDAEVGPFTYLRPGTVLGRGAKAGAYVEMKSARVGDGSKVPHLSYVGDATIGERSNIGAATVFVNYDGVAKHRTIVGDDVRVGSDTMLVAPVTIGDGAYTAAGSVITSDVPPGAMAVARGRQRNVEGWVERSRPGSPAAEAARRALASGATGPGDPRGVSPDGPDENG